MNAYAVPAQSRMGAFQLLASSSKASTSQQQQPQQASTMPCVGCDASCDGCCGYSAPVDPCYLTPGCTTECTTVPCDDSCPDACYGVVCDSESCDQPQCEPWPGAWMCNACPADHTYCITAGQPCSTVPSFPATQQSSTNGLQGSVPHMHYYGHGLYQMPCVDSTTMPPSLQPYPHPAVSFPNLFLGTADSQTPYPFSPATPSLTNGLSAHNTPTPPGFQSHHATLSWSCQWANCAQSFTTLESLKAHIDEQHLHLPGVACSHTGPSPTDLASFDSTQYTQMAPWLTDMDQSQLTECLWGDCGSVPALPENIQPGGIASALALAQHLLQDHLNEQNKRQTAFAIDPALQAPSPSQNGYHAVHSGYLAGSIVSPASLLDDRPTTSTSNPSLSSARASSSTMVDHACGWEGCSESFASANDLTEHITLAHVGGGRNLYQCGWAGCERNAEGRAFASKQKILRHMQSHTGYRPFECDVCHQHFSEPATLQQHKRRHTKEKPFVCDYPGCGKAFAITGALTIHKRTHNGEKPFKCPHCDRAFAESSNFTKHLRTHTGNKPYMCLEPDCGKCFSRPDQLSRHANVHRRSPMDRSSEDTDDGRGKYGD